MGRGAQLPPPKVDCTISPLFPTLTKKSWRFFLLADVQIVGDILFHVGFISPGGLRGRDCS